MKLDSGKVSRSSLCSSAARPARQVDIKKKMSAATTSGNQPPSNTFIMFALTKAKSTDEQRGHAKAHRQTPAPYFAHRQIHQHGGQQHRQRDGDTEGRGEIVRGSKTERQAEGEYHQCPVDESDIDLPVARGRGLHDVQSRA